MSHDLFLNDTARRVADLVLPATAWLEELGCKSTNTHLYLMPRLLAPPGEARSAVWILRELARRLDLGGLLPLGRRGAPWTPSSTIRRPATPRWPRLPREGGIRALQSRRRPPRSRLPDALRQGGVLPERAAALGLPALPVYEPLPASPLWPLAFRQGRTLTQFHGFYDHGRALPSLARLDPEPRLWMAPADAAGRGLSDGDPVKGPASGAPSPPGPW